MNEVTAEVELDGIKAKVTIKKSGNDYTVEREIMNMVQPVDSYIPSVTHDYVGGRPIKR